MKISKDKVVEIHYTLTNDKTEVIDSSVGNDPLTYIHGNGHLIPGLEKELEGREAGEKLKAIIAPEEGYGQKEEQLIMDVPKEQFQEQEQVKVGAQFQLQAEGKQSIATVTKVENDIVTLDLNHPLAGVTLNFDVEVVGVRDADPSELEHGHVHTDGNHDHQ